MTGDVSFLMAFLGGVLSFVSPCVLPLVPAYFCFLTGASLEELTEGGSARVNPLPRAFAFVLGFSTVFVALGAGASALSQLLRSNLDIFSLIAGAVVILLGLHFMGLFRIAFLDREARLHPDSKPMGLLGAYGIGLAFAFGWTPCIGPILGAILAVAATQQGIGSGVGLLAVYSLGLGIPFLLAAFGVKAFTRFLIRFRPHVRKVELVAGVLLVATGIAIMTGSLQTLGTTLFEWFPWLQNIG
ncbi:cytochrome c biogenesis protein CcdA [Alphaproteobacteria bacterium LMG 31809]|uniref:Cytochrome c biogenesis protein CcdA n=2 Tax=Govanella unica TaxID=2975056 RepID=A0A9X3TVH3_9PROT|nr:cytochrome c biogenesis protein CcdA [Govania unica]MDA5192479.1 cytochrome c biogenesis protein CcdA [Govania unica]